MKSSAGAPAGSPAKPRRRKTHTPPAKPTGNPATDPAAFEALLRQAGWQWSDVVKWLDGVDEYVRGDGGFADLTGPQVHKLVDHLTRILNAKGGTR